MKFAPRRNQIIGRAVIKRKFAAILRPNETDGITKFVLVDAVGVDAAAKGIKVGDVIVPLKVGNIVMDGAFRPVVEEENAGLFVTELSPGELLVQTENGSRYVPFDSEDAAVSLGAPVQEPKAAE